MIKLSLEKNE